MLGILGLDERTERVYRELIHRGPAGVDALALRLGLAREQVRQAVAVLEAKALASRNTVGQVQTAPPQLALGALLTAQRHALGQAELTAAALAEAYHSVSTRSIHDLIEVAVGADQVRQRLEHIQLSAETELLALVQSTPEVVEAGESPAEEFAVLRGVRYQVVIERPMVEEPGTREAALSEVLGPERIRVVEQVPTRLLIADRGTVLLPLTESPLRAAGEARGRGGEDRPAEEPGEPMALVSRAPGLVTAMVGLFECIWRQGVPVRLAEEGPSAAGSDDAPTTLDLRILSLLLLGSTDAAIAKQLGLGLRTVQRRVAHMMELAGVTTRLQLGWQAHRRGWLT